MRPASLRGLALACMSAPCLALQAEPLDDLVGTWTMRKDGLSFTVRIEPVLSGSAYQETALLDDLNLEISTALLTRDARSGLWTRTWFNNVGERATFVEVESDEGLALEMTTFRGEAVPRTSRLLLEPGTASWILDWQTREDPDATWTPREQPFEHVRVDRPVPPPAPGRIAFASDRSGDWEVYTMAPDGSDVVNVSADPGGDHFPRWIAGGSRIAFLSQRGTDGGGWERWEADRDGTDCSRPGLPELLPNPDIGPFPELHPSGSYVVYAAERKGEQDLFVARFDGGGERALAPAPGLDYRPRWSPDGSTVLFVSERDGDPEIYTVRADGSGLTRLTDNEATDRYARWSPDGEWIVYASDWETPGALELYLMRRDGSDLDRLTENQAEDGEPSWSPDGRRIVFRSNAWGSPELCIVDVESREITRLTENAAYDGEPVWSPAPAR